MRDTFCDMLIRHLKMILVVGGMLLGVGLTAQGQTLDPVVNVQVPVVQDPLIALLQSGIWPGATTFIGWLLANVVNRLREGGFPIHLKIELDSRSRRALLAAAKLDEEDEET